MQIKYARKIIGRRLYIVTFVVIAVFYLTALRGYFWEYVGGDSAIYLLLSESMVTGHGYRDVYLPDAPPHTKYPPGTSLLIAPILQSFGRNFYAVHFYLTLISIGTIILVFSLFRRVVDEPWPLLLMLLVALQPIYFEARWEIYSDIPYLALSLLTIFFFKRYDDSDRVFSRSLLFCFFPVAAFLTRTAGLAIIVSVFMALLMKGNKTWRLKIGKAAVYGVICGIPVLIWFARALLLTNGGLPSYISDLVSTDYLHPEEGYLSSGGILFRVKMAAIFYLSKFFRIMFFPRHAFGSLNDYRLYFAIAGLLVTVFMIIGWIRSLRKDDGRLISIYSLLYLLVLFLWPHKKERFLIPFFPFLIYFFLSSMIGIQDWIGQRTGRSIRWLIVAIMAWVVAVNLFAFANEYRREYREIYISHDRLNGEEGKSWIQASISLHRKLAEISEPDDVILCRRPQITYLLTGRKGVRIMLNPDANAQWQQIKQYNVRYILADKDILPEFSRYVLPALNAHPDAYQTIAQKEPGPSLLIKLSPEKF